jgi:hypothetical protein
MEDWRVLILLCFEEVKFNMTTTNVHLSSFRRLDLLTEDQPIKRLVVRI